MEKRDKFKQYAAFALVKLDEEHPDPVILVPSRIVAELGEEENKENVLLCERSLSWLEDNNFFKAGRRTGAGDYREGIAQRTFREARLTTLGFAALDVEIRFKGRKERIGDALRNGFNATALVARDALVQ